MKRLFIAAFVFCLVAFLGRSARADKVNTDYDHAVNFGNYHTYSWEEVKTVDSLWGDRIQQAVNQQLQAKGWRLVSSGSGEVVLFALGEVHNIQQEQTFYSGAGGWRWGGSGIATTSVYNSRMGSLVISMFDANSKKLIWRGTSTADLSDKAEKNVGKLNKAIANMFKKFPPKS